MRIDVDFDVVTCQHCGVLYGMPPVLRGAYGHTRFCPNGHTPINGVSLVERIKRAEELSGDQRRRIETLERSVASYRAAAMRAKKART